MHFSKILKRFLPQYLVSFIRKLRNGNYNYFFWIFPISKKKVVVCNYYGKGYGDNAKYIIEKLLEEDSEFDIVWLLKTESQAISNFPKPIRIVKYGSFRALYELATAKIWIDNSRKVVSPPKRRSQYYIQTWHSPLRLKKIEKDIENNLDESYIERAKIDSNNCDLMISGSDFSWNIYRNSFWYNGEILKCGTPRCDVFFTNNTSAKERVFERFGISTDEKVILYAPTFRNNSSLDAYKLNYNEIINALIRRFGGKWKLLIRLHPNVSELSSLINYKDKIVNATNYDDMQELLCASDILITDFSSCMFDMAIANKKCFLHALDLDEYLANERKLYFNFQDLPFYFSKTSDQLVRNILEFDEDNYNNNLKAFSEKINVYEKGTASQEIVERIQSIIAKK